jgi:hypothetical protein
MSNDIRRLLDSIGAPQFEYREVAAVERWQAAVQRWPLLTSVNRALLECRTLRLRRARPTGPTPWLSSA